MLCVLSRLAQKVAPATLRAASVLPSRNCASMPSEKKSPVEFQDDFVKQLVSEELITIPDFITEEEEKSLLAEIDPILTRARYQTAHWDDVSHHFSCFMKPF